MINVLIKGRNLYTYSYSEDDAKRHKEMIAIYQPKKKNVLGYILASQLPEGMNSANTLISDVLPPEM